VGNSVLWIRNDFRFHDNTALINAINDIKDNENLIFIYHLDPELIKIETTSYAYFFSSLNSYYESCLKKGLDIYFLYGEILTCFDTLLNEFSNIDKIYYNIIECGYGKSQEQKLNRFLKRKNVEVFSFYDHHLHSANKVLKEDNSHYKVFTHYYNKWMSSKKPEEQNIDYAKLSEIILSDFSKKDPIGKEKFIELRNLLNNDFSMFTGEEKARECLADFMNAKLCSYNENREYPFLDGTSHLSHYLTTGQLSVREVFNAATMMPFSLGQEIFIKELAWRDFYNMIYYFHPNQHNEEIIEKYRYINWEYDEEKFIKWKSGLTGFPIIDAAMRQLREEGWMHNRLRMITASFLIKDLLIDWRLGEKYFSEMLIDYDVASNIGGWQWAASVGTDAVPYFRIFNPITQSKKYDPEGKFIKRYVKELEDIPTQYIHEPFKFKKQLEENYGIDIKKLYVSPIVDHKTQRQKALEMFNI